MPGPDVDSWPCGSVVRGIDRVDPCSAFNHGLLDIVRVAGLADVAVIDDRYFNQHSNVSHDDIALTPIWITYDLLPALQLKEDQHTDYLSRMRSAGIHLLPGPLASLTRSCTEA